MSQGLKKALEDKDFSELIKGSGMSFLLRFVGLAVGYILTLLIANLFGAKGLGDYVLSITVLSLFTLFAKIGLDTKFQNPDIIEVNLNKSEAIIEPFSI